MDCGPSAANRKKFGQYFTSDEIANFMASLLSETSCNRILDCGAGIGNLTKAAHKRFETLDFVEQWEIDDAVSDILEQNMAGIGVDARINRCDFIVDAVSRIRSGESGGYTHAILNPPYGKIRNNSSHQQLLRSVGVHVSNLYAAFVVLSVLMVDDGGEVVAILPRSFFNGMYHRDFREFLFSSCAITDIHLFESRDNLFKGVLQENVIMRFVRGGAQGDICISKSVDGSNCHERFYVPYSNVISDSGIISVPNGVRSSSNEFEFDIGSTLSDLGIDVSTGPIVTYRNVEYLCDTYESGMIPLIYPQHFSTGEFIFPVDGRKPNAIMDVPDVRRLLYSNTGFYVVVRRVSSNEEKHRLVGCIVDTSLFDSDYIGFDNSVNVFHCGKKGLEFELARGLLCFLRSTGVDVRFREISGSTQVNVSDLRELRFPDAITLRHLGSS